VYTIHKNWGGTDEFALRTAVFVSFLKIETFRNNPNFAKYTSSTISISEHSLIITQTSKSKE